MPEVIYHVCHPDQSRSASDASGGTCFRNRPQFLEKVSYIHRNPVKRGLCERPEDWQWSSFRHHATDYAGRVEIESEWTA